MKISGIFGLLCSFEFLVFNLDRGGCQSIHHDGLRRVCLLLIISNTWWTPNITNNNNDGTNDRPAKTSKVTASEDDPIRNFAARPQKCGCGLKNQDRHTIRSLLSVTGSVRSTERITTVIRIIHMLSMLCNIWETSGISTTPRRILPLW